MPRLERKVAVVTGGASGIGLATTARFLAEGATVFVWDREPGESALERVDPSLRERVRCSIVDVTSEDAIHAALDSITRSHGGVDIVVNNAGLTADGFASDLSLADWERVLGVNLTGSFLVARAAIPSLRARGGGVITNTSSISSLGNRGQANYAAAKAGIVGLTRTLAQELARDGIRVNAVAPGTIDTPMFRAVPQKIQEKFVTRIPLGRLGRPEEIAALHAFLASEDASYITGQTIFCDGGLTLG